MIQAERALRALCDGGVDFIVVGGVAGMFLGAARVTYDLDVVYDRAPENLRRLVAALASHAPYPRGAPPGLPFAWDERTVRAGLNFTLSTALGDLDLLGEVAGGDYPSLLPHAVWIDGGGLRIRCVDLPTLIRLKRCGTAEGLRGARGTGGAARRIRRRGPGGATGVNGLRITGRRTGTRLVRRVRRTVLVASLAGIAALGCWRADPLRGAAFDAAAWEEAAPQSGERLAMLGDWLDRNPPLGRERAEIEAELGPPDRDSWNQRMPFPAYVVGTYDPTGFDSGTTVGLVIQYDGRGRVSGFWTPFVRGGTLSR